MIEQLKQTPQDILYVVEKAFDEDGTANYGCYAEVFAAIRIRANIILRNGFMLPETEKTKILMAMNDILTSLPDLHDDFIAQQAIARLEKFMPM